MDWTPLQTGASAETAAVLVLLGRAVAFVLALWIANRAYRGYRRASDPALLWLALGITLLAAVPTVVRFLVPTLIDTSLLLTTVAATGSEIVGLAAILYAVYGRP